MCAQVSKILGIRGEYELYDAPQPVICNRRLTLMGRMYMCRDTYIYIYIYIQIRTYVCVHANIC